MKSIANRLTDLEAVSWMWATTRCQDEKAWEPEEAFAHLHSTTAGADASADPRTPQERYLQMLDGFDREAAPRC